MPRKCLSSGPDRNLRRMDPTAASASMIARAEAAWQRGNGEAAMAFYGRAADLAETGGDLDTRVAAVLGLARGQQYNLTPGLLPVRLHAAYEMAADPAARVRLAAALARCWSYANEPLRARPFADEALAGAERASDMVLLADALDAALTAHWGPDELARRQDWAFRLGDAAAHLVDPDARLQAHLWGLTVAWEVLDLPRMHRFMRALEVLGEESARARFFAASRRLALEMLRDHVHVGPLLIEQAETAAKAAAIPDSESVLHAMRGYLAWCSDDAEGCALEAPEYEHFALDHGVAVVRAEAAVMWIGAGRPDKVREMIGGFTAETLAELPRDSDWLLTLQCVLEGALAVGDREVTAAAAGLVAPYAGRSVLNAGAVMWHGVTDDTLARAAALLGDHDTAARYRAAALATYERVGATWWRDRLLARGPTEPQTAADEVVVRFHEQPGGLWMVGRVGAEVVLPRVRGLEHLHTLLRHADSDVPVLALAGGGVVVEQGGLDILDEESRRMLRGRLAELDAQLTVHENVDRRQERGAIADYLVGATGLVGRRRTTGSHDERARVAVRKAIVGALARIAEADPWLGRHLHDRVRTGRLCRYQSDPDHPVRWLLQRS
ncbi:hypothetical protein [Actinomycetospora sp. CA-053990]|uniref:hypothetical protein n=1 Tax=Actinomycetospora sp. CA-053990 TaxID=3239891 RepID=UPI003D8E83D5